MKTTSAPAPCKRPFFAATLAALLFCTLLTLPSQAKGKNATILSMTMQGEPAGIMGSQQASQKKVSNLPDACKGLHIFYALQGKDPEQEAICRVSAAYGSGGSSEPVKATVKGRENKTGRVPSVLKDTSRRVVVECMTSDRFRPMVLDVLITCEGGLSHDEQFLEDLDKFLKTE